MAAAHSSQADHSSMCKLPASIGDSIQIATPSSSIPNSFFTPSIQAPTRGSRLPAESPSSSSGTPIPRAIENNAAPPSSMSRVWLM